MSCKDKRLHILLISDDGTDTIGRDALRQALINAGYHVSTFTPDGDASGDSAAIELFATIVVNQNVLQRNGVKKQQKKFCYTFINNIYSVSRIEFDLDGNICRVPATPVECVLAAQNILEKIPDLVISGINTQHNTGAATQFSGTVGAIVGATSMLSPFGPLPGIAVSLEAAIQPPFPPFSFVYEQNFEEAAQFVVELVKNLQGKKCGSNDNSPLLPSGLFLNVNYPALPKELIKGACLNKQGRTWLWRVDNDGVGARIRGVVIRGEPIGNIGNDPAFVPVPDFVEQIETVKNADSLALVRGFITIVPSRADYTADKEDFCFVERKLKHILKKN